MTYLIRIHRLFNVKNINSTIRCNLASINRFYAKETTECDNLITEKLEQPLRFTGSKAESWQAKHTRTGITSDQPWYQTYVISLSLAVFLIYFCILREENDVDMKLNKSLYDHITGLEEKQIEIRIEYNKQNDLDTAALESRLKELQGRT